MPGEVRVKVLAAGVSLPDVLAREGVHPETPRVPYTTGWNLVGIVDQVGKGVSGFELGQTVAAMPISGCYAQYVCLPQRKLIPVPAGLDPAEAVAAVLNYITAYQMLDRSAKVTPGQRVLIPCAPSGRHPIRESAILGCYILRNWFLPGRKSMVPYSIQWLMRLKSAWFRHDLLTLFDLLQQKKIKPLIAQRLPLSQAQHAHELLGSGGVIGKIVLVPNGVIA